MGCIVSVDEFRQMLAQTSLIDRKNFNLDSRSGQYIGLQADGIKFVVDVMKELPEKAIRKIIRQTMKRTLTPIYNQIISKAPVFTGNFKSGIQLKIKLSRRKGSVIGEIKSTMPHAYWVDEGFYPTGHESTAKRGPYGHPRRLSTIKRGGHHIFKNAIRQNADAAVSTFMRDIEELTTEAQKKLEIKS